MNEKGRNKKKKDQNKADRLKRLCGVGFCACGSDHTLQCDGECKEAHTNSKTGHFECTSYYEIGQSEVNPGGSRRPKRGWKFGRQKTERSDQREINDNQASKQKRRERLERDWSE